jgi:hypothetical protein
MSSHYSRFDFGADIMRQLLFLFLALPWWGYLPLAGGTWYLFEYIYQSELEENQLRAEALEAGPPDLVDIAVFDRARDMNPAQELNVEAWVNFDYNSHLTLSKNGRVKDERYLYILFGKTDDATSTKARGAVLLTESERLKFVEQAVFLIDDFSSDQLTFPFNGLPATTGDFGSLLNDALEDQGLTRADNFILIKPFLSGRAAGLAPRNVEGMRSFGRKVVMFLLALAVLKLIFRQYRARKITKAGQDDDGLMAGAALKPSQVQPAQAQPALSHPSVMTHMASGAALPQGDTPLERITRRQAERQQAAAVSDARPADPVVSLSQILRNKQAMIVIAVVLVSLMLGVRGLGFIPVFLLLGFYILLGKAVGGLKQVTSAAISRVAEGVVHSKPALSSGQADRHSNHAARTRAKKAQDPFDRLAAQVRSDRGI